jgi:hypothetical protein
MPRYDLIWLDWVEMGDFLTCGWGVTLSRFIHVSLLRLYLYLVISSECLNCGPWDPEFAAWAAMSGSPV